MTYEPIADGPVERSLDELFDRLAGTGAAGRRSLAEAEDHLRTATAAAVAAGEPAEQAERGAVARFGSPASIAAQLKVAFRGPGALIRPVVAGAFMIGAVGAVALGVSGGISELFGRVFGAGFVAGDRSGVTYTPARCADYFEYFPHAGTCAQAAALHHWGEVVVDRVALGVLGLIALAVGLAIRRSLGAGWARWRPPATIVALVTAALAGVVAAGQLGVNVLQAAFGGTSGVGAGIADGTAAAVVAVGAVVWGVRRRTRQAA